MFTFQTPEAPESGYALEESQFNERLQSEAREDGLLSFREDAYHECEEVLIDDHRANLGPAELVEHKLSSLLGGAWLPVSHMRVQPLQGSRSHC